MIVDASALVAILKSEPEKALFIQALADADAPKISPVNWHVCAVRMERDGDFEKLEGFIARARIMVVPIDEIQMRLAHQAWRTYGKGRHAARLNLGDCFAYALAKAMGEPLLFKGGDFPHTDIVPAV